MRKRLNKVTGLFICIIAAAGVLISCSRNSEPEESKNNNSEITLEAEHAPGQYQDAGTGNKVTSEGDAGEVDAPGDSTGTGSGEIEDGTVGTDKKPVVMLDPGHGGIYSGAVYTDRYERDLNLKVAELVKEYLNDNYPDIEVRLTRTEDKELSPDIVEDLKLRVAEAVEAEADVMVSLHFNSSEQHKQSGCMIFVSNREKLNETATKLSEGILKRLTALGIESSGTKIRNSNDTFDENGNPLDYYAVIRHAAAADMPCIIVEHCFIDNETDWQFFDSDEALKKLAEADAIGIAEYFGYLAD